MTAVPIENPVINSPFVEPARHFRVVDGQVSGEVDERRRPSEFFVPVAKPRKASPQMALQFGAGVRQQQNARGGSDPDAVPGPGAVGGGSVSTRLREA